MIDNAFAHHCFPHIWDRCPEKGGPAVVISFPLETVEYWVRESHSAAKAKFGHVSGLGKAAFSRGHVLTEGGGRVEA